MLEAGIVDPAKVTRIALQNAARSPPAPDHRGHHRRTPKKKEDAGHGDHGMAAWAAAWVAWAAWVEWAAWGMAWAAWADDATASAFCRSAR